jgi:hypothetical protein
VPGDTTELIVRKGRVMLEGSHTKVKGGNKVVFSASSFSVAKLETDKKDNLETWSKDRAQLLARANSRIPGRALTTVFASFRHDWTYSGLGGRPFWLFNNDIGCYTLIPFAYGWESPYGGFYSRFFYSGYGSPYCCGRGPIHSGPVFGGVVGGSPIGSGSGGSGGSGAGPSSSGRSISDSPMTSHGKPDLSPGGDGPAIRPPNKE